MAASLNTTCVSLESGVYHKSILEFLGLNDKLPVKPRKENDKKAIYNIQRTCHRLYTLIFNILKDELITVFESGESIKRMEFFVKRRMFQPALFGIGEITDRSAVNNMYYEESYDKKHSTSEQNKLNTRLVKLVSELKYVKFVNDGIESLIAKIVSPQNEHLTKRCTEIYLQNPKKLDNNGFMKWSEYDEWCHQNVEVSSTLTYQDAVSSTTDTVYCSESDIRPAYPANSFRRIAPDDLAKMSKFTPWDSRVLTIRCEKLDLELRNEVVADQLKNAKMPKTPENQNTAGIEDICKISSDMIDELSKPDQKVPAIVVSGIIEAIRKNLTTEARQIYQLTRYDFVAANVFDAERGQYETNVISERTGVFHKGRSYVIDTATKEKILQDRLTLHVFGHEIHCVGLLVDRIKKICTVYDSELEMYYDPKTLSAGQRPPSGKWNLQTFKDLIHTDVLPHFLVNGASIFEWEVTMEYNFPVQTDKNSCAIYAIWAVETILNTKCHYGYNFREEFEKTSLEKEREKYAEMLRNFIKS